MRLGKRNVIQFLNMLLNDDPISGFLVQQQEDSFGLASFTHSARLYNDIIRIA